MQDEKEKFLRREFAAMAWSGASQRNKTIYKSEDETEREKFREDIRKHLDYFTQFYNKPVQNEEHVKNISKFGKILSKEHSRILKNGELTFGTCQKVFNLYLKFLWVAGYLSQPPHCPIDSFVLRKAKITGISWTQMSEDEYKKVVATLRGISNNIAEWELEEFNEGRK